MSLSLRSAVSTLLVHELYPNHSSVLVQIHPRFDLSHQCRPNAIIKKPNLVPKGIRNKLLIPVLENQEAKWDFARISMRPNSGRFMYNKAGLNVHATMCASSLFNLGTAIVLPLYILMIIAPQHKMTKKTMESHVPYVALSLLYAYVLVRSWTPQHLGALFGGSNMMPDFRSVGVLFFSKLSATAAWIHLLLMDLFATRYVFLDGLHNEVETRHSVALCLFFCPMGIVSHFVTRTLTKWSRE